MVYNNLNVEIVDSLKRLYNAAFNTEVLLKLFYIVLFKSKYIS